MRNGKGKGEMESGGTARLGYLFKVRKVIKYATAYCLGL